MNKFSCAKEVYKIAIIRWRIANSNPNLEQPNPNPCSNPSPYPYPHHYHHHHSIKPLPCGWFDSSYRFSLLDTVRKRPLHTAAVLPWGRHRVAVCCVRSYSSKMSVDTHTNALQGPHPMIGPCKCGKITHACAYLREEPLRVRAGASPIPWV